MNPTLLVNILIGVYYFLFGIIIGSFLNVCIYRIPLDISIAKGNSFCTSCNHRLYPKDLVPLFSYIFLGGKCRYCKAKISFRYPLVESLTGFLFLSAFLLFGFGSLSLILCAFFAILVVIAFIDFDTQMVFDRFHIMIFALGILSAFLPLLTGEKKSIIWLPTTNVFADISILDRVIGMFAVSLPLILLIFIYETFFHKEGMGGGDIKLFAALGFFLGWRLVLFTLLFSSIIGAVYGLVILVKSVNAMDDYEESHTEEEKIADATAKLLEAKENENKEEISKTDDDEEDEENGLKFAFVPCIAIGTVLAIAFGDKLIALYMSIFFK